MNATDPFAEFDRPKMSYEELQAEIARRPKAEPLPPHWELFDPPEVKRIRPGL